MRIKFDNTYFPKPVLNENLDDFNKNSFKISYSIKNYDKIRQKLTINVSVALENEYIKRQIKSGKVVPLLHLEQITQRQVEQLSLSESKEVEIDLLQYATNTEIEVMGILYCKESFALMDVENLNDVYRMLDKPIYFGRGDIIGYSNYIAIKLPEDRRIGSIFNLNGDKDKILNGDTLKVSLTNDLIDIILEEKVHKKLVDTYRSDPYVKKLIFSSIVIPALITAYTEMFNDYPTYKEKKWCKSLADKIEKEEKLKSEEIFVQSNYELDKIYHYVNIAMGDLYKDAIEFYHSKLEGDN
ncbi:MAG: hypothetical protein IJN13_03335 [Bacilli bacterium]|nr:hypothetical protein [Bacilli bacterium]